MSNLGEASAFYGEASRQFGEASQAFSAAESAAGEVAAGQDEVTETAQKLARSASEISDHAPAVGAMSLKTLCFILAEGADWSLNTAAGNIDPHGRNPLAERVERLMDRQLQLVEYLGGAVDLAEGLQSVCAEMEEASGARSAAINQSKAGLGEVANQAALLSGEAERESQSL